MNILRLTTGILFVVLAFVSHAQDYARARIIADHLHLETLARLGVAMDHIHGGRDYIEGDFSKYELKLAVDAGFEVRIIAEDAEAHYLTGRFSRHEHQRNNVECIQNLSDFPYSTPKNYLPGSLKGNYTYEEMLLQLDLMALQFPHLISPLQKVDGYQTYEGRPIHWLRISDNPDRNEDEPEILYTALHHAREPVSLTQLIYFMWYVLENYEKDQSIKFLLDNTELYFLPCINPDGYVYNQTTHPQGGGLWRKNRRDNEDGTFGVDLNRNYGFKWGLDNVGSSDNSQSEVYRGPSPFSEPETQAVRAFVLEHDFKIALNYHTYGGFLIYPYGYTDDPVEDVKTYQELALLLTRENRYVYGTGLETVSYFTNGDADDWMYGDDEDKSQIFSLTPEVGLEVHGFWPDASEVEYLSKSSLKQNLDAAFFLLNSGMIIDESESFLTKQSGQLPFRITKLGFDEVGLQVSIVPLTDNITIERNSKFYILDLFTGQQDFFDYRLADDINDGEKITVVFTVDNGSYTKRDTITKTYRSPRFVLNNRGEITDWRSNGLGMAWEETNSVFYSAPSSLTDSPRGNYIPYTTNDLTLAVPVSLQKGDSAVLTFKALWDIQYRFDYMVLEVSTDGSSYMPLCGNFSKIGLQSQLEGSPVYSGRQLSWVTEEVNLSEYIGEEITLRFLMVSTNNDSRDGIYLDDIKVLEYTAGITTATHSLEGEAFTITNYPNPATQFMTLESQGIDATGLKEIYFFNAIGVLIDRKSLDRKLTIDVTDWTPGLYFYTTHDTKGTFRETRRFVIQ
ncbi:MAG: M14 family zinc carboxypeptidase [Saprospiraceae bacterium]|nr:M14 family zinc carboxypeptidase [Saprospiraceae bacterium]